jgi:hypothetical protein
VNNRPILDKTGLGTSNQLQANEAEIMHTTQTYTMATQPIDPREGIMPPASRQMKSQPQPSSIESGNNSKRITQKLAETLVLNFESVR